MHMVCNRRISEKIFFMSFLIRYFYLLYAKRGYLGTFVSLKKVKFCRKDKKKQGLLQAKVPKSSKL